MVTLDLSRVDESLKPIRVIALFVLLVQSQATHWSLIGLAQKANPVK